MLKHRTKEELVELIYRLEGENYNLQMCNEKQSDVLKSIAEKYRGKGFFAQILRFFALPFQILQILKSKNEFFFITINKLESMDFTKEQVLKAQKAIVAYENKKMSALDYKNFVSELLQLTNICDTCDDVMGNLHDNFQKRMAKECKDKYPELLPKAPNLKSGKFTGDFYANCLQTYHFKGLTILLSKMKTDTLAAKQRPGLQAQYKLMEEDCAAVKEFIELRKKGLVFEEETTGKVALDNEDPTVLALLSELSSFIKEYKQVQDAPNSEYAIELKEAILEKAIEMQDLKFANLDLSAETLEELAALMLECEGIKSLNSNKASDLANEIKEVLGSEDKVVEGLTETTNEAPKEKRAYNDEEAALLKETMTLAELGIYYGTDPSTIKRRLDKYKESLGKVEKDKEGEGAE